MNEQLKEFARCANDPVYFVNTYGHAFNIEKGIIAPIKCFEYQEEYLNNLKSNQNNIVLKARQTGISVITAAFICWMLLFGEDERILVVADNHAGALRFLNHVKVFLDNVPMFLQPDARPVDNTKEIKFSNGCWVRAVASSKNAGRGETLTMLVLDEVAFIEHADDIWKGSGLALAASGGKCAMISCVTKDTFIFTNKGMKQMKDFVKEDKSGGYEISEYSVLGKNKTRKGNLFFNNGFVDTKKIYTKNSKLEGSLNHKLWAYKNGKYDWYKLQDLEEGDYVSIQYGSNIWGSNNDVSKFKPSKNEKIRNEFNPKKITKEIAYLIGLYISEGSVYKKFNKKNNFIGGSVTITCGDNVSKGIKDAGLHFTKTKGDNLHYYISSKNFIEFLEYVGFDLSKKEKEIPSRVLEMSKENIAEMLKGIFDGDGYSRKDKGSIGISLSSKKLLEQIRLTLLNFGILSMYQEGITPPTEKVKVESKYYRIELNYKDSLKFYQDIGFKFKRKQNNKQILKECNLKRSSSYDIVPNSIGIAKKTFENSKKTTYNLRKSDIFLNCIINKKTEYKTKNISRNLLLKLIEECKEDISEEDLKFYEKIICKNIVWNKIEKTKLSKAETFDFSLPDNKEDFWCHSVVYNGILGHQTPNGVGNLYHKTWVAAEKKGNNPDARLSPLDFTYFRVHWSQHPIFSKGLEEKIDEEGTKYLTSPWYENECERLHYDRKQIAQELDLSFEGSGSLVINDKIIERYSKTCINIKPICYYDYKLEENNFINVETTFHIWHKPREGGNYILGADVARGGKGDYSTIEILDADNLEQVAEYQGQVAPDEFARIIFKIAKEYNEAYVAVECNSFGLATTLMLKNTLRYKENRMFHSVSVTKLYNRTSDFFANKGEKIPGFQTTTKTRPVLISALIKHMNAMQVKINSNRLLSEFSTFIYNGDKAEHQRGFNDDLIFAFAIALLMRDTEIDNVFWNKKIVKAMIEGISYSSTKWDGNEDPDFEDLDNPIWLYGPITSG